MDARFETRKEQLLEECQVDRRLFEQVQTRLERFMEPFVKIFGRRESREHAHTFVKGLLSDLEAKNTESIAYRFGQDRQPLQRFVGWADWDEAALRTELARQVGEELGEADGVLALDPSAFPKSGPESVGTARQWCGHDGKVDNCQVAVYLGYVSRKEHALVETRLYLPQEWTRDRKRLDKANVPKDRTRHQLALEMIAERGPLLPHGWVTGDDEMGRPSWFRRGLHERGGQYLLAIPSNILIRELDRDPPPYQGAGQPRKRPWQRVDQWTQSLPKTAWKKNDVRDAAQGPLAVEIARCRVAAREGQRPGREEVLVVIRWRDRDQRKVTKVDYYLSNASPDTPLEEFARVAKAHHRIEECLQRAKSEAGLADYETRNWTGWHHHQTLSLIAAWFLVKEARRGKNMDPRDHAPTNPTGDRPDPLQRFRLRHQRPHSPRTRTTPQTKRTRTPVPLETT